MAGVILDLESAAAQPSISPLLGRMLSIAAAAVGAATLLAVAALPHSSPARAVATGQSILEEAFARPKPRPTLDLQLPDDLAAEMLTQRVNGISGLARPAPTLRAFRLRDSGGIVIVAMLPDAPAIIRPGNALADELSVHGVYAVNYSVEATSISAVRWTENGMTYEVSSPAVLFRDLVGLAEQVR